MGFGLEAWQRGEGGIGWPGVRHALVLLGRHALFYATYFCLAPIKMFSLPYAYLFFLNCASQIKKTFLGGLKLSEKEEEKTLNFHTLMFLFSQLLTLRIGVLDGYF